MPTGRHYACGGVLEGGARTESARDCLADPHGVSPRTVLAGVEPDRGTIQLKECSDMSTSDAAPYILPIITRVICSVEADHKTFNNEQTFCCDRIRVRQSDEAEIKTALNVRSVCRNNTEGIIIPILLDLPTVMRQPMRSQLLSMEEER